MIKITNEVDFSRFNNDLGEDWAKEIGKDSVFDVRLLTEEEAEWYFNSIGNSKIKKEWWLNGDGDEQGTKCTVYCDGDNWFLGFGSPIYSELGVRPALDLRTFNNKNFETQDKLLFGGKTFTVIDGEQGLAICDELIGICPFNEAEKCIKDWFNKI